MFCQECGQELPPDQKFCTNCGESVQPAGRTTSAPAAPAVAGAPVKPARKWLLPVLACVGVAVVVAAVLVLVLVVFKGGGGPESVVGQLLKAAQAKDTGAAMKTIDPDAFKNNKGLEETFKTKLFEGITSGAEAKFTGVSYNTKTGGDKGTVKIVKGTMTVTKGGKQETTDLAKSGGMTTFNMVRKNGKWYISLSSFGNIIAADLYEKAKKITEGSMQDATDKLLEAVTDFGEFFNQQPAPTGQQAKEKLNELYPMVQDYKQEVDKANALLKEIGELKGSNLEEYLEYADLALELFEVRVKLFEKAMEMYKFAVNLKISAETGQPIDQSTQQQYEQMSKEIQELTKKEGDLMKKVMDIASDLR